MRRSSPSTHASKHSSTCLPTIGTGARRSATKLPSRERTDSTRTMLPERIDYTFQLPAFEGPLDLLLKLIEREELNITEIALAQVADQYLAHVRAMEQPDPG